MFEAVACAFWRRAKHYVERGFVLPEVRIALCREEGRLAGIAIAAVGPGSSWILDESYCHEAPIAFKGNESLIGLGANDIADYRIVRILGYDRNLRHMEAFRSFVSNRDGYRDFGILGDRWVTESSRGVGGQPRIELLALELDGRLPVCRNLFSWSMDVPRLKFLHRLSDGTLFGMSEGGFRYKRFLIVLREHPKEFRKQEIVDTVLKSDKFEWRPVFSVASA